MSTFMVTLPPTKVVRSNRRTLALQILPDKTLVVKAPLFVPQFFINQFINNNQAWIDRQLQKVALKKTTVRTYQDGEQFLYLGNKLTLKIGDYKEIKATPTTLEFPKFLNFRIKKELNDWFIKNAKEKILTFLQIYSQKMSTSYKSVTFSDTHSKWGSCTHDNRLQFCWRLIMAPDLVIRYVVIHELAHTTEKNHSRSFWAKVRAQNPSYKQQIKWLADHGDTLVL